MLERAHKLKINGFCWHFDGSAVLSRSALILLTQLQHFKLHITNVSFIGFNKPFKLRHHGQWTTRVKIDAEGANLQVL